jgi:hypothetical protein
MKLSLVVGGDCYSPAVIKRWLAAFARAIVHAPVILDQVPR